MQSTANGVALFLSATALWLASSASAQTAPSEARRPDPLNPKAQVPTVVYRSAFKDYRPNTEAEVGSWKDANTAVHQAGGWRAYAKEARQADQPAHSLPAASAASAPSKPAAKPSGHAHH
ncbi:MAG TPA: hypothetical protein VGE47_11200 [Burkholderiaceae bacterium]